MKILKGIYKGIELAVPQDGSVRPTVDHFKKHILRMAEENKAACVWDLFAGSGGVGLEFLSLGSEEVLFVEELNKALSCLRLNLAECQLKDEIHFSKQKVHVVQSHVENFLKDPKNHEVTKTPDLVFLDPPYGQNWMKKIIPLLQNCSLVSSKTLIIAEHVTDDSFGKDQESLKMTHQEIYGPKALTCFRKQEKKT